MRIINKKYLLIILLTGVILTGVILAKANKEEKLDDVILKQEVNNNAFAMYTEIENGYQKYEGYSFPKGYVLNLNKSKCMDNKGNEIENALYTKNDQVGVKSNKSFYCYLYFDLLEEKEFEYTGNYQVFIAPKDGDYEIKLWGASGGSTETGAEGGKGAYTKGTITLNKQDKLYIYVGESGEFADKTSKEYYYKPTYNGGGSGLQNVWGFATSGGGATDIRLDISETGNWDDFNSLKSRIIVAGGGGGSYWFSISDNLNGGYGGALNGGNGKQGFGQLLSPGEDTRIKADTTGGTQTSGGIPNDKKTEESFGKFGKGGNNSLSSSGGGGGYYGGAGGSDQGNTPSSGAGGSSFISGYQGCIAIDKNSTEGDVHPKVGCTEDNLNDIECSHHYSNKIFTQTEMIAGNAEMPTHDGKDKMVGNNGNGYARIKLINVVS